MGAAAVSLPELCMERVWQVDLPGSATALSGTKPPICPQRIHCEQLSARFPSTEKPRREHQVTWRKQLQKLFPPRVRATVLNAWRVRRPPGLGPRPLSRGQWPVRAEEGEGAEDKAGSVHVGKAANWKPLLRMEHTAPAGSGSMAGDSDSTGCRQEEARASSVLQPPRPL